VQATVDRLVGPGATVLQYKDEDWYFAALMQDAEGNEFDVV
jgi:hypothetical protein